jgi:hypothetical protein
MNRRVFLALPIAFLPVVFGGCAAGGAGAASGTDRDLLTLEDLAPYQAQDAYSAIRRLRSIWLNVRGTGSYGVDPAGAGAQSQIQVYVDGARRADGIEALRSLLCSEIQEIRHLDARDATMQYGTDHGAGAILVTTR